MVRARTPARRRQPVPLRERAEKLAADFAEQDARHLAEIAAERERADKANGSFEALLRTESEKADRAIAAFEALAQRLEAMAEATRTDGVRMACLLGCPDGVRTASMTDARPYGVRTPFAEENAPSWLRKA